MERLKAGSRRFQYPSEVLNARPRLCAFGSPERPGDDAVHDGDPTSRLCAGGNGSVERRQPVNTRRCNIGERSESSPSGAVPAAV